MVSVCPAAGVQVSGVADPSLEEQEQGQQYPVPQVLTRDSQSVFRLCLSRDFLSLRYPEGVNYEFI